MRLNNVFEQPEKPEEEKKLEVVSTSESRLDDLIFKLVEYFEQNSPTKRICWSETFEDYKQYLQSYTITSEMVSKINLVLPKTKNTTHYLIHKGSFLSALIQTSYNQGNNGFEFEKVNAHFFGAYLKGSENNPIKIKAKAINGWGNLRKANYCSLEAETINGNSAFEGAKGCVAEIANYKGRYFGWMSGCKVYSPNLETCQILSKQANGKDNHFILGKITDKRVGAKK